MAVKLPTDIWRERISEEKREFAAGLISIEDCVGEQLYPDEFLKRADVLLTKFVSKIEGASKEANSFPSIMESVKSLVLALNDLNYSEDFDVTVIETGEREDLCEFIHAVIVSQGFDLTALAAFAKCCTTDLTLQWREW